ncbi:MAG: cupredoxin domain-containing protein [Vicinamibacterales bacterium]
MASRILTRREFVSAGVLCAGAVCLGDALIAQEQGRHEIAVTAKRYEYAPSRIEVAANDVVKITLVAEDIPHSFTIDEYRISKRAAPGRPVTFEFRADRVGTFPFYCNLTADEGCREMRGELVVTPRRP